MLFFAYRDVDYVHQLRWQFDFDAHAPRSLRATKILESQSRADAALALMGDKQFLFSQSGRAFLMYGCRGRAGGVVRSGWAGRGMGGADLALQGNGGRAWCAGGVLSGAPGGVALCCARAVARGESFYNLRGLRAFKDKFAPGWEARYLAASGGWGALKSAVDVAVLPEIERFKDVTTLCMYGEDEEDSACPAAQNSGLRLLRLAGGHHFDGDYDGLAQQILAATHVDRRLGHGKM